MDKLYFDILPRYPSSGGTDKMVSLLSYDTEEDFVDALVEFAEIQRQREANFHSTAGVMIENNMGFRFRIDFNLTEIAILCLSELFSLIKPLVGSNSGLRKLSRLAAKLNNEFDDRIEFNNQLLQKLAEGLEDDLILAYTFFSKDDFMRIWKYLMFGDPQQSLSNINWSSRAVPADEVYDQIDWRVVSNLYLTEAFVDEFVANEAYYLVYDYLPDNSDDFIADFELGEINTFDDLGGLLNDGLFQTTLLEKFEDDGEDLWRKLNNLYELALSLLYGADYDRFLIYAEEVLGISSSRDILKEVPADILEQAIDFDSVFDSHFEDNFYQSWYGNDFATVLLSIMDLDNEERESLTRISDSTDYVVDATYSGYSLVFTFEYEGN